MQALVARVLGRLAPMMGDVSGCAWLHNVFKLSMPMTVQLLGPSSLSVVPHGACATATSHHIASHPILELRVVCPGSVSVDVRVTDAEVADNLTVFAHWRCEVLTGRTLRCRRYNMHASIPGDVILHVHAVQM